MPFKTKVELDNGVIVHTSYEPHDLFNFLNDKTKNNRRCKKEPALLIATRMAREEARDAYPNKDIKMIISNKVEQ